MGFHQFALECHYPEQALMRAIEGVEIDETMQAHLAEHKLAQRQFTLGRESALAQAMLIDWLGVIGCK